MLLPGLAAAIASRKEQSSSQTPSLVSSILVTVGLTAGVGVGVGVGVGRTGVAVAPGTGVGVGVAVGVGVGIAVAAGTGTGVAVGKVAAAATITPTDRSRFMSTDASPPRLLSTALQVTADPGAETTNITVVPCW